MVLLLTECISFGQQTTELLHTDDPELYFGFFSFQSAVEKDIRKISDPSGAAVFRQAAARHLNISEADLAILQRVAGSTLDAISNVTSSHRTYLSNEAAAGRMPDAMVLASFQTQRVELLKTGAENLRQTMSLAGWQAVQAYVNGQYRAGIVHKEVTRGK